VFQNRLDLEVGVQAAVASPLPHPHAETAHALTASSAFPNPIAELAAGPVFLDAAVREFATHPRRPRPAVSAR
jgi:hypothetical protein